MELIDALLEVLKSDNGNRQVQKYHLEEAQKLMQEKKA
jgi:hypothetical protein